MKRNYLRVPGQKVKITVTGPSGSGKTSIIDQLQDGYAKAGLLVSGASGELTRDGYSESFMIECPTPKQAQAMYFETLSEHEIATLKGHLSALGYEL